MKKNKNINIEPIRQLMLKHGTTAEKLSFFTGIPTKSIKQFLKDGYSIASGDVQRIAKYYDIPFYLLKMKVFTGCDFKTCRFYDGTNRDCKALKKMYCMNRRCSFWKDQKGED